MKTEKNHSEIDVRIAEPDKDIHLNAENENDWIEFDRLIAEIKIKKENNEKNKENNISLFEHDLYYYDEMITEGLETKARARRIKTLLLGRLGVLKAFGKRDDEFKERYNEAIEKAKLLIEKVNYILPDLPEPEPGKDQPRKFALSKDRISRLQNVFGFVEHDVFKNKPTEIDKNVSEPEFLEATENADFSKIIEKSKKNKLMFMVFALGQKMLGDEWYTRATDSIKTTKSRCSGQTISDENWKKRLIKRIEGDQKKA